MQKRWKKGIRDALCTLTQGKSICVKWKLGLWKSVMVTKEWFKKTDFLKDAVCLNAHWDCSLYATVRIYHCPAGCVGLSCTYIWLSRVRTGNTYIILITKRTQKTTATRCLSGLFYVLVWAFLNFIGHVLMLFNCLSAPCCLVIRGIEGVESYQLTCDSLITNNKITLVQMIEIIIMSNL